MSSDLHNRAMAQCAPSIKIGEQKWAGQNEEGDWGSWKRMKEANGDLGDCDRRNTIDQYDLVTSPTLLYD